MEGGTIDQETTIWISKQYPRYEPLIANHFLTEGLNDEMLILDKFWDGLEEWSFFVDDGHMLIPLVGVPEVHEKPFELL